MSCDSRLKLRNYLKEWVSIRSERERRSWCKANYIHHKAMLAIQNTVRDTTNTLRHRFGVQLPAEFAPHDETSRRQLKRLINECFQGTLAVYSGHRMVGYISVSDGAVNRVHPGSSLMHVRGALPRFIIYNQVSAISMMPFIMSSISLILISRL